MRGNGERIGPQNLPTSSIAGGIWNLLNQQRAQQRGAWPSATPAVVTDPYFMYVPLLLNTTSTNGQQNNTFLDSSTNNFTITRNGTPTQGSFTPYQPSGYWSGYFNGSTDYLNTPSSASLSFGTSSFTMEMWVYSGANGTGTRLGGNGTGGSWSANNWVIATSTPGNVNKFCLGVNNTSSDLLASTSTFNNNQWMHVAITRSGSSWALFVNGVRESTATNSASLDGGVSKPINLGFSNLSGDSYWAGYISNFRVVIGSAVYSPASTTITVPTTPLTAITNTSLLTLQSNRFIDNSTNAFAITVNGTPKVQAFQPFSPAASYSAATYGGSGYFSSGNYINAASNAAFGMGTGDFTIEAWIFATSAFSGYQAIFGDGFTTNSLFFGNTAGGFGLRAGNVADILVTTAPSINQWVHVACTRSGTTVRLFYNGVQQATTTSATNFATQTAYIGNDGGGSAFIGYISNLRLVKGTAIYTAAFTPPTLPVTAVSGTSLLTNFGNAGIYDAAWQNNALTVGDAQASTTQYKWSPTSMKYDGTGDWLTAIDSPGLQLGSGDFTIEGWVYLAATGVAYGLISKGTASTGWSVNVTSGNKLQFSYTSSNLTGATSLSASTWYYFAVVRSGTATGNLKVYLNGTADATSGGAVTDNFNQTSTLYIGADRIGTSPLNGYVQDLRITKGVARTITTPTAAFPTR